MFTYYATKPEPIWRELDSYHYINLDHYRNFKIRISPDKKEHLIEGETCDGVTEVFYTFKTIEDACSCIRELLNIQKK